MTWSKDETAKVTLQYDNPALWTGLELYGNLLTYFLLYSLILAAFVSTISKMNMKISPLNLQLNSSHNDFQVGEVRAQYPTS